MVISSAYKGIYFILSFICIFVVTSIDTQGKSYKVKPNDNLTLIANQFETTPVAIAKANKISVNSVILPGQILFIPELSTSEPELFINYTVKKGDKLSTIAKRFNTNTDAISSDNDLANVNNIYIGQKLKIRQSSKNVASQSRLYRVKQGDDLSSVAKRNGTTVKDLVRANQLKNANFIKAGQLLRIPSNAAGKLINPSYGLSYDVRKQLEVIKPNPKKWKRIMVHHTATEVGNYKSIDSAHRRRGMQNGLAYHFLIGNGKGGMKNGEIAIGGRWKKQLDGGHTAISYLNATSIGICLVGDFEKRPPSSLQMKQLTALCRYIMAQCGIPKSNITTHKMSYKRYKKSTACPGKYFSISQLTKEI